MEFSQGPVARPVRIFISGTFPSPTSSEGPPLVLLRRTGARQKTFTGQQHTGIPLFPCPSDFPKKPFPAPPPWELAGRTAPSARPLAVQASLGNCSESGPPPRSLSEMEDGHSTLDTLSPLPSFPLLNLSGSPSSPEGATFHGEGVSPFLLRGRRGSEAMSAPSPSSASGDEDPNPAPAQKPLSLRAPSPREGSPAGKRENWKPDLVIAIFLCATITTSPPPAPLYRLSSSLELS